MMTMTTTTVMLMMMLVHKHNGPIRTGATVFANSRSVSCASNMHVCVCMFTICACVCPPASLPARRFRIVYYKSDVYTKQWHIKCNNFGRACTRKNQQQHNTFF